MSGHEERRPATERERAGGVSIAVRGVEKSFPNGRDRLQVLRGITLDVDAGETVSITGESGSGKSTLLSLLAGLDKPDLGEILVGPDRVEQLHERDLTRYRARTVGLVFQFHYLLRDFSALENVMLPALIQKRDAREVRYRAERLLAQVGLEDRNNHYPPQLSGGERQRVAAARALINDPAVIFADEPTGNLDDHNSGLVEDTLLSLVEEHGKTLLIVTHNSELAARAARTFHLEKGCLVSG